MKKNNGKSKLKICPFCAFEFYLEDSACQHGCPLSSACGLVRCPSCDYEFADEPRAVSWLARLLGRRDVCLQEGASGEVTVGDLAAGERARVREVHGASGRRRNALAVFGLVPGAEVELVQRQPAFVVRVGQTELALDAEIAREIFVEPSAA